MTALLLQGAALEPPSWPSEELTALLRAVLILAGVLLLTVFLLRVWIPRQFHLPKRGERMRVLERLPLDSSHALYLVQVEGELFLLGTGESGVRSLARLARKGEDRSRSTQRRPSEASAVFSKYLARLGLGEKRSA